MGNDHQNRQVDIKSNVIDSVVNLGDNNIIVIVNYCPQDSKTRIIAGEAADLDCPYVGLYHFEPEDAEFFYGREVFVEELFAAVQSRNFIPLVGASGSGKSSVVFAGLVPKLQAEGHWKFTHFRPGHNPFLALAQALIPLYVTNENETSCLKQANDLAKDFRDGDIKLESVFEKIQQKYPQERMLLIMDQFEEIYIRCEDEEERRKFLDLLLVGFQNINNKYKFSPVLVATLRIDFSQNVLSYPPFADFFRNNDIQIRSMNFEELQETIEKPAERMGVSFEAGLVDRILDDY